MKLVVVLLAVLLLIWLLLGSTRRRAKDARRDDPPAQPAPKVEGMIACAHCGVHLPASLSLQLGGRAYCSVAHRDAGPRVP